MVRSSTAALAVALLSATASVRLVAADIPTCGPDNPCPASAPCCSQYGQCGVGAYCLGGCDPLFSHSLSSCVAAPVCNSDDFAINNLDGIVQIDEYLGDSSKANWVASGSPLAYNGGVLLTMAQDTVGTLLASTHYVWYGKISAKLRTSQGKGVVTAFIMMSDVRDEIDFEFVGVDIANAQSNYYSQGVTVYTNMDELAVPGSNTVSTTHEYTIDWTPDKLTWSIDGTALRTVNRKDTWNDTTNRYDYPQTPSRVMLSLWPAGLSTNGEGTIEWAGGLVDWSSAYMQNGYYYAIVDELSVECYDPPSGANVSGSKSYVYNDEAGTNDTVAIVDQDTVLASFYATGEDVDKDPDASSTKSAGASKTSSGAAKSTSSEPETVPGMSGAGSRGEDGTVESSGSSSSSSSSGSSSGGSSSSSSSDGGFDQGLSGKSGAGTLRGVGVGVAAVLGALVGLVVV